jgi:hypothetical protein
MSDLLKSFGQVTLLSMLCLAATQAPAQNMRDPTLPPGVSGPSGGAGSGQGNSFKSPLSLLIVDGVPHVVVGTRLYAQGQKLGEARIERITETEVWLREGGELRKVSTFSGVQRRAVAPSAQVPDCAAQGDDASRPSETKAPVAGCDSAKP